MFSIGSANLNLRSMAVDSEHNILSEAKEVKFKLRCDLFSQCSGMVGLVQFGDWSTGYVKEREATEKLGIRVDAERNKRYSAIYDALEINPDLRLNRLDAVLPLPPAALPEW